VIGLSQKTVTYSICAILLLAASLRFYGLTERGIFDYDEAWYLLESKSLYDGVGFIFDKATGVQTDDTSLKAYLKERGNTPITSFKPGHTLLVFLGFLVLGVHDYASFGVSALLGTLTVWILYRLGRLMFDDRVGLLAALILAVSTFHIGYARSGYAQAKAIFFIALGVYLWFASTTHEDRKKLFLSGLSIGYGFSCHFNLFTIPLAIAGLEAYHQHQSGTNISDRFRQMCRLGLGMANPLIAFELPARILSLFGKLPEGQLSYAEQYFYRGQLTSLLHFSLAGGSALADKLWVAEGPLVVLGLIAGLGVALRRIKDLRHVALILLFLLPALPWSILSVGLPPLYRTFSVLSVPVSLLAALGLVRMIDAIGANRSPTRGRGYQVVCVGVLAVGVGLAAGLLSLRSTYREATDAWMAYAQEHGGQIDILPGSSFPIWYFYLSTRYDSLPEDTRNDIGFYPGQKDLMPPLGAYDVIDEKRYMKAVRTGRDDLMAYLDRLSAARPAVVFPNPVAHLPDRYREIGGTGILEEMARIRSKRGSGYVTVVDLRVESDTEWRMAEVSR